MASINTGKSIDDCASFAVLQTAKFWIWIDDVVVKSETELDVRKAVRELHQLKKPQLQALFDFTSKPNKKTWAEIEQVS